MHRKGSRSMLRGGTWEGAVQRSFVVLVAWVGLLVLGLGVGHAVGAEVLSVPGAEVAAWRTWAATTDPLVLVMSLLRAAALGVAWYLLVTTLLAVVARGLRLVRLVRVADAVAAPAVRRLVQRSMGVVVASAIATSVVVPPSHAAEPPPVAVGEEQAGVLTMRGVLPAPRDSGSTDGTTVTLPWQRLQGSEMRHEDRSPSVAEAPAAVATSPDPAGPASPSASRADGTTAALRDGPAQVEASDAVHTVRPGESLWRIAEARLEQAWGRVPRDAEVVPYWRDMIDRNRDRLVVPDEPDLILPGQELLLPTVVRP
jgi:hypothetical protein